MEYTEGKIIEIVRAYASLVEAKNMLDKMKDGGIRRSPYNITKIDKDVQGVIAKYVEIVPESIRNVLSIKPSDLEEIILSVSHGRKIKKA